jgi:nucleoside-diphosphate-sugar epimerase
VLGNAYSPETWIHLIATIDVVINALGGTDVRQLVEVAFEATRSAAAARPAGSPKLTYIFTSGTWVHGDKRNTGEIVTDTTPVTNPPELVQGRPANEQRVVKDDILNGIVIRPGYVYGKGGSYLANLFAGASQGKVRWAGWPGGRFSAVHADDLADLYVRVAERAPAIGGLIFDATNDFTESVEDVLAELVRVSGAQGPPEVYEPTNSKRYLGSTLKIIPETDDVSAVYEEAYATTALTRPYLARSLLGWQPRKLGLCNGLELYYSAWKASQGVPE